MKKIFIIVLTFFLSVPFFSQNLNNVYLDDDVYSFLEYAQSKGYCSFLIGSKPYTQKQILNAFYECLEHEKELSKTELQILHSYKYLVVLQLIYQFVFLYDNVHSTIYHN